MKRRLKLTLGIGGIVLVTALVGLGAFLYFGSRIGVWIVVAGVPLVIVGSIGIYVRGVVLRSSTGEGELIRSRARDVAWLFRDELTVFNRLRDEHPHWNAADVETRAAQLAGDFDAAGVAVDVGSADLTVRSPDRIQEFDRLETEIGDFRSSRDDAFRAFARDRIDHLRSVAGTVGAEFLDGKDSPSLVTVESGDVPDDGAVDAIEPPLRRAIDQARGTVTDAVERIEESVEEYGASPEQVRERLETARNEADAGDFDGALRSLETATEYAEGEVADSFEGDRDALDRLLSTVDSTDVADYVSPEHAARVDEIRTAVAGFDSALDTTELRETADRLRSVCLDMVAELEDDLASYVETVREADVPVGFYTAPPAVATSYGSDLRSAEDLAAFRLAWLNAVGELLDAVSEAETRAAIAESYPAVSERIEEGLRASGEVAGDDLPVREPVPFLELYAETTDGAAFDPSGPAVRIDGGGESYALDVTARLARSTGDEHDVTLSVAGSAFADERRDETYVAVAETFAAVPFGEYTVEATTSAAEFDDASATVHVDDDTELELVLPERGLRERVCGRFGDEVEEQLSTVSPELADRFAEHEYLAPELDFPIADEYVPCLLVVWAEAEGYTAAMDDDRVLVYDHGQFRSRVETIIRHNLSDGDTMTYDDMRTKFLSVPASNDLISDTVRDLGLDVDAGASEVRR